MTKEKDGTEKILKSTINYDSSNPLAAAPGQILGYKFIKIEYKNGNRKHIFAVDTTIKGDKDQLVTAKPDALILFKDTYVGTT